MLVSRVALRLLVVAVMALLTPILLTSCSSDDATEATDATEAAEATDEAAADAEGGSDEFCQAVNELESSLLLVDVDSVEQFEAWYAEVEAAYADVQASAGDEYSDQLAAFEEALNDFGAVLETEGVNVRALIDASAELAVAAEVLAEQTDCVTV